MSYARASLVDEPVERDEVAVVDRPGEPARAYPCRVQNIVVSARLGVAIDLFMAAEILHGTIDRPRFPAVMVRLLQPTVTFVIFANGKVQIVGACHIHDALLALYLLAWRLVSCMHLRPNIHGIRIRNVVCSFSLGSFIDVGAFARDHPLHCVYNPDTFEGAQYYLKRGVGAKKHSTAAVLFGSGRIVLTGARSRDQHIEHMRQLIPLLHKYRRVSAVQSVLMPRQLAPATRREYVRDTPNPGLFTRACVCDAPLSGQPVQCSACSKVARPCAFADRPFECEHGGSWTMIDTTPMCDSCGWLDDERTVYRSTPKHKRKNKTKHDNSARVHKKRKRFKPDITQQMSDIRHSRTTAEDEYIHALHTLTSTHKPPIID